MRHRILLEKETYLIHMYEPGKFVLNGSKYYIKDDKVYNLQDEFQGNVYNLAEFDLQKSVDVVMKERAFYDGKNVSIDGNEYVCSIKHHISAYTLYHLSCKTGVKELIINEEGTFISSVDGWKGCVVEKCFL